MTSDPTARTEGAFVSSRTAILLTATLGSAVLYGISFPPLRLSALAWIAQIPFLVAVRRGSTPVALLLGWSFTVTVSYVTGDWLPHAVATYYEQRFALGAAFFLLVATIMASPYVMLFAVAYQRIARLPAALVPIATAAAWVAHELARATVLTGNPWATLGYSQARNVTLVQVADITGVYGISFVLVTVNVALAEMWLASRDGLRRALPGAMIAAALVATTAGYGVARMRSERLASAPGSPVSVAIVQGNLDLGSQWREDFYGRNLDAYLRLTDDVMRSSQPRLVIWPESSMTFFLEDEPLYRKAIAGPLMAGGAQLLAGGPRHVGNTQSTYYNSVFLISPQGDVLATYDKQRLLPFAEYFPSARLDFLRRGFDNVREFTPGPDSPPLPTVAGKAGILICNEAMFAAPAAARVSAGAQLLVNPANDTWLGDVKYSEQAFDIVALRAVEQRRYLVRTSTGGPSAIVDPFGRVVKRTEPFTQGWIGGTVTPLDITTLYHRFGDAFAVLCTIAATLAALAGARIESRADDPE